MDIRCFKEILRMQNEHRQGQKNNTSLLLPDLSGLPLHFLHKTVFPVPDEQMHVVIKQAPCEENKTL